MSAPETMAIVPVDFRDRAARALAWAGEVAVVDDVALASAVGGGAKITHALRDAEDARDAMVRPLNERVKAINAAWKMARAPYEQAKADIDQKIGAYQAEKRQAAEAEARLRAEEEARAARKREEAARAAQRAAEEAAAAERAATTEADIDKAIAAEEVARHAAADAAARAAEAEHATAAALAPVPTAGAVRTDRGTMSSRARWTFRVIDAARVPREFCEPADRLIRAAVAGGARAIPGVEVYAEEQVTYR